MSGARPIVVGIGASAGGLEAFHAFFDAMPADSGMAFVVVLHLPASRESLLPTILERWTVMPVRLAEDGELLCANTVYVPPPHASAELRDGCLRLAPASLDAPRDHRPIDGFFATLAASLNERAVGIVLSGTGSDGALGLKAIKHRGGLTIAQGSDGTGPLYPDMPAGAIATGAVDLVAPVQDIPGHLLRLRPKFLDGTPPPAIAEDLEALRQQICIIIRSQVGHDFSGYKSKTFLRRVTRRMDVLNLPSVAAYVARLEQDRDETVLLFRDLLIRVTSFFRDDEAFAAIERIVVPRLFADRHADRTVRVWVPGCATGEEAYSLAMLLCEHMDGLRGAPKVQIFGTDIDEPAIATARLGRYPGVLLDGLSDRRRERFFTRTESGYAVAKEIRDICTFSPHSLVRDPPFSRIDLVSCRNLLIYLDTRLQNEVIPAFHYALVPDGVLILGISESTARYDDLFSVLDKPARIFQRRNVRGPPAYLPAPAVTPAGRAASPAAAPGRWRPTPPATPAPAAADGDPAPASTRAGRAQAGLVRLAGLAPARLFRSGREAAALRLELEARQAELQSLTEEHQTAVEELRSANEELHSVNEELQSTVEELETSREEIQSVNEELHTVNAQLSEKVDELDQSNTDLKNLFDSTQIATVFLDRHLIVRSFTPAAANIYKLIPSDVGRPLTDIVHCLTYDGLRDDVARVLATQAPLERRVARRDPAGHYIMRILPYRGQDSAVSGTLVTFLDVTGIVEAEQHQRLLVDELNHRVKNMLTVVISLASQTLRRSATLEDFETAYLGRVHALAAFYSLLSRQNWHSIPLRDVIAEAVQPFVASDRASIVLDGGEVALSPAAALALGMATHELATNAVKYGALSLREGVVSIAWRAEGAGPDSQIVITWRESDGPGVVAPARTGFGTLLIERGLSHELGGAAVLDFRPAGLHATLRIPVARLGAAPDVACP